MPTRVEFEEGTQISNASCGDKHSVFVDSEVLLLVAVVDVVFVIALHIFSTHTCELLLLLNQGGCWACGSDQWLQLGQGICYMVSLAIYIYTCGAMVQ